MKLVLPAAGARIALSGRNDYSRIRGKARLMAADGRDSVLAHVAWKFPGQTETVATEALGYILSRSVSSRAALRETLRTGGADVPPLARVATEVTGQQGERLDLVGFDESNAERVLIEVKFWAGLTHNQPNTYLSRLPKDGEAAVLLFVAPEQRLETLWVEIRRRAATCFDLGPDTTAEGLRSVAVNGSPHRLMLTSWRTLLSAMTSRAGIDGDSSSQQDILQLDALCERQDSEAFLPLREEEFAPEVPRRMLGLRTLIDNATDRARKCKVANTEGLRVASTKGLQVTAQYYGYGRYIHIGGMYVAWFGVHHELWARQKETPLWLVFYHDAAKAAQKKLGGQNYGFTLPTGVEYDAVLDSIVEQLQKIADAFNS